MANQAPKTPPRTVLVGLNGAGSRRDSLLALALLKSQGVNVVAVHLKFPVLAATKAKVELKTQVGAGVTKEELVDPQLKLSCAEPSDIAELEAFCKKQYVPFEVVEIGGEFEVEVIDPVVHETLAFRRPEAGLFCLERVLIPTLFQIADQKGIKEIGLGYHAQVFTDPMHGKTELIRSANLGLDQSSALSRLRIEDLKRIVLPLGALTETMLNKLSRELGIGGEGGASGVTRPSLVMDEAFFKFVEERVAIGMRPRGIIRTEDGTIVGEHRGLHRLRVGDRHGLKVMQGQEKDYVVVAHDPIQQALVVSEQQEKLFFNRFRVSNFRWLTPVDALRALHSFVTVGEGQIPIECETILYANDTGWVELRSEPISDVIPGDRIVFYQGDKVMGSAMIDVIERVVPPKGSAPAIKL